LWILSPLDLGKSRTDRPVDPTAGSMTSPTMARETTGTTPSVFRSMALRSKAGHRTWSGPLHGRQTGCPTPPPATVVPGTMSLAAVPTRQVPAVMPTGTTATVTIPTSISLSTSTHGLQRAERQARVARRRRVRLLNHVGSRRFGPRLEG